MSPKLVFPHHALSSYAHTDHPDKAKKKKATLTSNYTASNPPPKPSRGWSGRLRLGRRGPEIEGGGGGIGLGIQHDIPLFVLMEEEVPSSTVRYCIGPGDVSQGFRGR